jgi:hypothetical protein
MMPPATKIDLTRAFKALYAPPARAPALVEVPEWPFLMIDGRGDPNTAAEYRAAIAALYSIAYPVKFAIKRATGRDYAVMPLEGLWWAGDQAAFAAADRSAWRWTLMIRQPDEATPAMVEAAVARIAKQKPSPALAQVRFERFAEGLAVQVLHRGPYADEYPTLARLHAFIEAQGYRPRGKHHEIYLTDPARTAPEKLRTVLRQPVSPRD